MCIVLPDNAIALATLHADNAIGHARYCTFLNTLPLLCGSAYMEDDSGNIIRCDW